MIKANLSQINGFRNCLVATALLLSSAGAHAEVIPESTPLPSPLITPRQTQPQPATTGPHLEVQPDSIVLASPGDSAYFWVYIDGRPVEQAKLDIAGSYDRFFQFTRVEGEPGVYLVQTMADSSEYGAYTLLVQAAEKEARIPIRIGTTEDLAPDKAVTHTPLRLLRIQLPTQIYEGQRLQLDADLGPGKRWYHWRVNGEAVLEGTGKAKLDLLVQDLGPLYVSVVVREGGQQVARWEGRTEIVPYPAVEMTATVGRVYQFTAPAGYTACEWRLEGEPVASGVEWVHRFATPGTYTIECRAQAPRDAKTPPHHRQVWKVTVR